MLPIEINDPKVKVIPKKHSKLMAVLNFLCSVLEFICFKKINLNFMSRVTTVGNTIYLGDRWRQYSTMNRRAIMAHEYTHILQWRKWSMIYVLSYFTGIPILLPVLSFIGCSFLFSLLFSLFFSAGLSMRGYWEWQAFKEQLLVQKEKTYKVRLDMMVDYYTDVLTGQKYFFALWLIKPVFKKIVRRFIYKNFKELKYGN